MHIDGDTYDNLEFDTILKSVSLLAVNELARQRILDQRPVFLKKQIETMLREIDELKEIMVIEGGFSLDYYHDIRPILHKIEPFESYLEIEEIQKIQKFIDVGNTVKNQISKFERFQLLSSKTGMIEPFFALTQQINNTIDPAGQIYDNASPDLKNIRKEISHLSKQIHIQLERIQKKYTEHLQEEYITLREGRLVLPVREFSVNKVPGIVHGQSATGQTQYVEPMQVVSLNNEMQSCFQREKKEIIRILKNLSEHIRNESALLLNNFDIVLHLDTLQAKTKYAVSIGAIAPEISTEFIWHIKDGFHPILLKKLGTRAVPLNLDIGSSFHVLIITGPNAGGKTVALKTIGLLQLLLQSGFQIPVGEGSKFPVCREIYAIIGDEQSIENDLSTFSSHIMKLSRIAETFAQDSLVLIDEIGSGTDPAEGAALAITFLEKFLEQSAVTIVTTHHSALKAFAQKTPGVNNGAMQFDAESLTPRFNLETGIPGSSYAFDISRRLGVSESILARAGEILGGSHTEMENIILELSAVKDAYEKKLQTLSIKESEMQGLLRLYQQRADELKKKKKSFERDALDEAQEILKTVNRTIESVIRDIKESNADRSVIKTGQQRIEKLKNNIDRQLNDNKQESKSIKAELSPGLLVKSTKYGLMGEIIQILNNGNDVELAAGDKRIIIPAADLVVVQTDHVKKEPAGDSYTGYTSQVLNELDIRGMSGEDAVLELAKYLDHARIARWKEIRVIHGKGTGTLRKIVHNFLKNDKHHKSFRLGNYGEGDTGVTVIEL